MQSLPIKTRGITYESIFAKGYAEGFAKGVTKTISETIVDILKRRLGSVNDDVRMQVLAETNIDVLRRWQDIAFDAIDGESAQRLANVICKTRSI
jgi:hypothetical protein